MPKEYTLSFKREAIHRYEQGTNLNALSQEFHIALSTLYHWRKEYCSKRVPSLRRLPIGTAPDISDMYAGTYTSRWNVHHPQVFPAGRDPGRWSGSSDRSGLFLCRKTAASLLSPSGCFFHALPDRNNIRLRQIAAAADPGILRLIPFHFIDGRQLYFSVS